MSEQFRALPGTELKRFFNGMLTKVSAKCLCHSRAILMDIMGCRWCVDNIEYLVDWLEEEADFRKLFENEDLKRRMEKFASKIAAKRRWLPKSITQFVIQRSVQKALEPGEARRLLMKRLILICVRRAENRKRHYLRKSLSESVPELVPS